MTTTDPLAAINLRRTPQTEQADPRQVKNNAGGYVFTLDDMARLRRFLVLGSTGGSYYTGERELTRENADVVIELARTRGTDVVAEVLAVSLAGRAPKQQPTIFTLAAVAGLGDNDARQAAFAALPQVCRTGTHLFLFTKYVEQFRGWGRGLRRAVGSWYVSKSPDQLAYQVLKYRNREGWTHRDVLRVAHPQIGDPARGSEYRGLFDFLCGREIGDQPRPKLLDGFLAAQAATTPVEAAAAVAEYGLSWEMIKTEHLTSAAVWGALLDRGMPQTALMRNLPRLTNLGLLSGSRLKQVTGQLSTGMARAKVHPVNVLVALRTYASGHSLRGDGTWTPVSKVVDALDAGFYEAFGGVEAAGKRTLLALDVSGSMTAQISGLPLTCREASAAMAMVTVATEPDVTVVGFTAGGRGGVNYWSREAALTPLDISARRRLDDNIRAISNLPFGGTDCALPWTWALEQGHEFDTVVTLTDSETFQGRIHVSQATRQYRQQTGIAARSIIAGMTSTGFTVNDPQDPLGLDVVGMDSSVPNLIADFSAGRV